MLSLPLAPEHAARLLVRAMRVANCGTGAGGFQPGNTCAMGEGDSDPLASEKPGEHTPAGQRKLISYLEKETGEKFLPHGSVGRGETSKNDFDIIVKAKTEKELERMSDEANQYQSDLMDKVARGVMTQHAAMQELYGGDVSDPFGEALEKIGFQAENFVEFDLSPTGRSGDPEVAVQRYRNGKTGHSIELWIPLRAARDLSQRAEVFRTARRRPSSALHAAAEAHDARLAVAVRYAFARGRAVVDRALLKKVIASRANLGEILAPAADAVGRALREVLRPTLAKVLEAGGKVGAAGIVRLRTAAFDPNQPRDEEEKWTTGGGLDSVVAYHGTVETALQSIKERGLVPGAGRGGDAYAEETGEGGAEVWKIGDRAASVYFSRDKQTAHEFGGLASELHGGATVVTLEIHIPITHSKNIVSDEASKELRYNGSIPPEWIQGYYRPGKDEDYVGDELHTLATRSYVIFYVSFIVSRKIKDLRTAKGPRTTIKFAFNALDQRAVDWADRHAAELVTRISETTREDINNAIAELLETGDWETAYDDLLAAVGDDARAALIARHETMQAVSEGQRQAWDQAVDEGLLTGEEKRVWLVTPDDKLCPICEGLEDKKADLRGVYVGDDGEEYDGPPAHVECRCTEGIA